MRKAVGFKEPKISNSSHSHHFHVKMSSPSHSHHFHFHINISCPESPNLHPTVTTTTTTATAPPPPHNDDDPQTQETPDQQHPKLDLHHHHHHQQQQSSNDPGMVTSINLSSPITHADVSIPSETETPPTLPTHAPLKGCSHSVSKKCKLDEKKQQALENRCRILMKNFNPIPFVAPENLDFPKHERVLKRLGLWDFVHMEFDKSLRVDLIAELVASYDSKLRCSYVNGIRIAVNRADLARALKLPVKKKGGGVSGGVELDFEGGLIGFIEGFVSNWVLLHDDTRMMEAEVLKRKITDGHPENVDWAGWFWFMVEKELTQGVQLKDCYYASHLQCLIKSQCEELFLEGEAEKVEIDAEVREEVEGVASQGPVKNGGDNEQAKDSLDKSSMELLASMSGKRVLGDENQPLNGSNKRLRIDGECHDKASEKVSDLDRLHKTCSEEIKERDEEILRLKGELNRMKNLVKCYREASKETDRIIAEFKQCCELPKQPITKDARPRGIAPSAAEKGSQRLKQEEEDR